MQRLGVASSKQMRAGLLKVILRLFAPCISLLEDWKSLLHIRWITMAISILTPNATKVRTCKDEHRFSHSFLFNESIPHDFGKIIVWFNIANLYKLCAVRRYTLLGTDTLTPV